MEKILIEIFLPASGKKFEVFVPIKNKLSEIQPVLADMIASLSIGVYTSSEESVLCDKETGIIYNINLSIEDLGLKNGSQLILI